jgi:hypothetical protein
MKSPYTKRSVSKWRAISEKLLTTFPLPMEEIVSIVKESWEAIFLSELGPSKYKIGVHLFPQPQIMGFLLHELIGLELQRRHPDKWRRGITKEEPDVICLKDDRYSFEIKTSSSPRSIFGNRSSAHVSRTSRKTRSGYYLAINFGKFKNARERPGLKMIRFGWLDAGDWIGQKAETGQQSKLKPEANAHKLIVIWDSDK